VFDDWGDGGTCVGLFVVAVEDGVLAWLGLYGSVLLSCCLGCFHSHQARQAISHSMQGTDSADVNGVGKRCRRGGHVARCKFVDIGVIVLEHMGSVEVVVRDPDVQSWLGVRCWMWGMSRRFTRLRLSPRGLAFSCDSDFDVAVEIVRQAGLHWYGCQKFCWKAGPLDFVLVLCWCGVRALRCVSSSI